MGGVSCRVMLQLLETGTEVVVIEQDWESDFVRQSLKHRMGIALEAHQQRERRQEERRTIEKRPPAKPDDRMQVA